MSQRSNRAKLRSLRQEAYVRQAGRCLYCGVRMWLTSPEELAPWRPARASCRSLQCTAEHLVARSAGGADSVANIAAACALCNLRRHRRARPLAPTQYRQLIRCRLRRGTWHADWVHQCGLLEEGDAGA